MPQERIKEILPAGLPDEAIDVVQRGMSYTLTQEQQDRFVNNVLRWQKNGRVPKDWTQPPQQIWWFIHHQVPLEYARDISQRIDAILYNKPDKIQRLRVMRPVKEVTPLIEAIMTSRASVRDLRVGDLDALVAQYRKEWPESADLVTVTKDGYFILNPNVDPSTLGTVEAAEAEVRKIAAERDELDLS